MLALFCYRSSHTRCRAKHRQRVRRRHRPTATASRSRSRPSRSPLSRRSTMSWTKKIWRRLLRHNSNSAKANDFTLRGSVSQSRQSMPSPRHRTFDIAGHAGPAHLGPHRINGARGGHADLARQGRAAVAVAAHARQFFVDKFLRDQIERSVVLGGEARPVPRIGTAGAAGLAGAFDSHGWAVCLHGLPLSAECSRLPSGIFRSFPDQAPSPSRAEQIAPLRVFFVVVHRVGDAVGAETAKIPA